MGDRKKYETHRFKGILVTQNASGRFEPKADAVPHLWRTGKHTKGQFKQIGQIFLTENGQSVAVLQQDKLAFNQRHDFTPLQRWTAEYVPLELLAKWL